MALLKYWRNGGSEWKPVGVEADGLGYVPVTGGTIDGPFPMIIDTGSPEINTPDLWVGEQINANGVTTTLNGFLDMPIRLEGWASIDFGGAELTNIATSAAPSGAVSRFAVEAMVAEWIIETFTLGPSWKSSSITNAAHRSPMVRRNREHLVILGGLFECLGPITMGPGQPLMTLNTNCRPRFTQIHSTFCTMNDATYCRIDIDPQGLVYVADGPAVVLDGAVASLDGISFYAAPTVR